MRLSEKRKQELYNVISAEIMNLRVEVSMNPELADIEKLDQRLFDMNQQIWIGVKTALNLQD